MLFYDIDEEATMDDFGAALADPKTYADRKRYHALLTTLRHEDPLHRATPEGFRPFWVATKHADITEIGRQPDVFLSGPRLELFSIDQEERVKASTGRDAAVGRTMLHMDGREHRSYRGITQSWFLPTNMRRLEQQMEDFAREYVDKLAAVGGEADFVPVVSELFPLNVILLILGLPPSEAPHLLQLTRDFVARENVPIPEGSTRGDQIVKVAQAFFDYFAPVFEERRKHPQNDVASVIALGQHEGKPIDRL
ncbi:MAG: cytochrome P450, partial [Steroidobacteraceae bacterium]